MIVNRIQGTNFQSDVEKKRYMTSGMQENAQLLMDKMNQCDKYTLDDNKLQYTVNYLLSVENSKSKFTDESKLYGRQNSFNDKSRVCSLKMGSTTLYMDANSGEVFSKSEKSFFSSWSSIFSSAENCLENLVRNFDNSEFVKKNFLSFKNYTKTGIKNVQNAYLNKVV